MKTLAVVEEEVEVGVEVWMEVEVERAASRWPSLLRALVSR